MNIIVQDMDWRYNPVKTTNLVFKDESGDWDYLFESLRQYRDYLKKRKAVCNSIGKEISIQAHIDRLESLFTKYVDFIKFCEDERYNDL